jgi:Mce-associated membrane protein
MSEGDGRREQVWLIGGALAGVIVAGVIVALLIVSGSRGGNPPARSTTAGSSTGGGAQSGVPFGTNRDDSLRAAEEAAVTLNTLDYKTVQPGLDRWEAVAAGPLLDQLKARRSEAASTAEKAKSVTTAKVVVAAVAKISPDASSAEVLALVEVTVTDSKGTTTKQVREKLGVIQTAAGWKISAISTVEPG